MTKAYISGPMSNRPDFNYPAFFAAADQLREMGCEPLNPAEGVEDTSKHWTYYMRLAIRLLMDADEIWMLEGWEESRGAKLEKQIAEQLQMPVKYFNAVKG